MEYARDVTKDVFDKTLINVKLWEQISSLMNTKEAPTKKP